MDFKNLKDNFYNNKPVIYKCTDGECVSVRCNGVRRMRYISPQDITLTKNIYRQINGDNTKFISLDEDIEIDPEIVDRIVEFIWIHNSNKFVYIFGKTDNNDYVYSVTSKEVYTEISTLDYEDVVATDVFISGNMVFVESNFKNIVNYSMSESEYLLYHGDTELVSYLEKPRPICVTRHTAFNMEGIEFVKNNLSKCSYIVKQVTSNKLPFDKLENIVKIYWTHFPMNAYDRNYIFYKGEKDGVFIYTLISFIPKLNGEEFFLDDCMVFVSDRYNEIVENALVRKAYDIFC